HAHARDVGFRVAVNPLALPREGQLVVSTAGASGARTPMLRVWDRMEPKEMAFRRQLKPLMVCTVGRSGSTVLMKGLKAHREIGVSGKQPYEVRYFQYCVHAARVQAPVGTVTSRTYEGDFYMDPVFAG